MSRFRRYDHLERLDHRSVRDILLGRVFIFPKLDGSCASVWAESVEHPLLGIVDATVACGSRNRVVTPEDDNQGFAAWAQSDAAAELRKFVLANPQVTVYGEWMVPHTLKTYRPEAWRRFWIFDVHDRDKHQYLPYEEWGPVLQGMGLDVVEPLCIIQDPSAEQVQVQVETNSYLIADGAGLGEGVVAKNYDWRNRHGHQPWAKVVRNAFKEDNRRAFGTTEKGGEFQVEVAIVEQFVTPELVGKTRAKIVTELANENLVDLAASASVGPGHVAMVIRQLEERWRHKLLPQLLGRVYHDLVTEEIWAMLKKHKNPVVNFKLLQARCTMRTKDLAKDLFQP